MSGICGFLCLDGAPAPPGLIEKMTGAMDYRGPDGIRHWVRGSAALGQCMLRTTPESFEEQQPLTNEDESLVLVMDGRVDNWEELRRELLARGARLRNRSDAELVLRSYELWGRECVDRIDGDFALVIWDAQRREAFCARDRIGNKPFHYHWDGKTFVFASEPHPILTLPWVREVLNPGMLAEFLANEWHSRDETFWQGVSRLVAAHRMIVDGRGPRIEAYWEPDLEATVPCTSDEEYVEYYRALVTDLVRRMSRSSQPARLRSERRARFLGDLRPRRTSAPAADAVGAGGRRLHAGVQRRLGRQRSGVRAGGGGPSGARNPRDCAFDKASILVPGAGGTPACLSCVSQRSHGSGNQDRSCGTGQPRIAGRDRRRRMALREPQLLRRAPGQAVALPWRPACGRMFARRVRSRAFGGRSATGWSRSCRMAPDSGCAISELVLNVANAIGSPGCRRRCSSCCRNGVNVTG